MSLLLLSDKHSLMSMSAAVPGITSERQKTKAQVV